MYVLARGNKQQETNNVLCIQYKTNYTHHIRNITMITEDMIGEGDEVNCTSKCGISKIKARHSFSIVFFFFLLFLVFEKLKTGLHLCLP